MTDSENSLAADVPIGQSPASSQYMEESTFLFAPIEGEPMTPEEVSMLVQELGGFRAAAREIECDATSLTNYARGLRQIPMHIARSLREACQ